MKLYHGSNVEVINPEIVNAKGSLDFGAAFYTTSDYEQAKKWAKLKKERTMKGAAIVSEFDFDEVRIKDLEIRTFTSADKEWLKYISSCRKLKDTDRTSDIIIGPVANDNTITAANARTAALFIPLFFSIFFHHSLRVRIPYTILKTAPAGHRSGFRQYYSSNSSQVSGLRVFNESITTTQSSWTFCITITI